MGFPADALLAWVALHIVGQLTTPDYPPQLCSQYVIPDSKKPGAWFSGWGDVLRGWSAQKASGLLNGEIEIVYWGLGATYFTEARAAAALSRSAAAWESIEDLIVRKTAEAGTGIDWASDPTWAIVART